MGTDTTSLQRVTYGYDVNFRLDSLTVTSPSVAGKLTRFGYNGDGMLTYRTIKRGANNATTIDSTAYAVTAVHQQWSITHSAAALGGFTEFYTRDSLERITQRSTAWGVSDTAWTYAYDKLGQLASYKTLSYPGGETCTPDPKAMDGQHCTGTNPLTLSSATYTYDSVGNRTDGSPTLLPGNRLTSWQGSTLTYDSVGNLVHKQKVGWDQFFYWNSLGQLDSVKTNGTVVAFGYDGFGRRVRKTVGAAVYRFIYDGDQILTVDSSGTRIRTYSYYPGVDQPHSMVTANGTGPRYYYLSEAGAGSVWGIIDTLGTVKNRYRYAAFGALADSLETVPNPYRFTGREYDAETQLYYYRARYYDPSMARFVSEDPIGLNGGVNDYAYAAGDPVNRVDPAGLWSRPCIPMIDGSCNPGGGGGAGSLSVPCVVGYELYPVRTYLVDDPSYTVDSYLETGAPVLGDCTLSGEGGGQAGAFNGLGEIRSDSASKRTKCKFAIGLAVLNVGADLLLATGVYEVVEGGATILEALSFQSLKDALKIDVVDHGTNTLATVGGTVAATGLNVLLDKGLSGVHASLGLPEHKGVLGWLAENAPIARSITSVSDAVAVCGH